MNVTLALAALLTLLSSNLILALNNGNGLQGSSNSAGRNSPRICLLANCNYFAVSNVCGRYGRSNLCKRFTNNCLLRFDVCAYSVTYTPVSISMCAGIPQGQRRKCAGSSSSSAQPIYISTRSG